MKNLKKDWALYAVLFIGGYFLWSRYLRPSQAPPLPAYEREGKLTWMEIPGEGWKQVRDL